MSVSKVSSQFVVDTDTHFWQPFEIWQEYLDAKHHSLVSDYIEKAGLDHRTFSPTGKAPVPGQVESASIRADDSAERLAWMDSEGIDACVIYPSTMTYLCYLPDADVSSAVCRALNQWSAQFAAANPNRLKPCMLLPWYHPERALEEFHVAAELGLSVAFATPTPSPDRSWSDAALDPVWGAMQDKGVVMTFHEFTRASAGASPIVARPTYKANFPLMYLCGHTVEIMLSVGDVVLGGVFERFPRLRFGFVEGHAAWLPGWLDMMDTVRERKIFQGETRDEIILPSELFKRQGFVAAFPEDKALDVIVELVGPEVLTLSTDYPHANATYGLVEQFATSYPDLIEPIRQQILGGNAAQIFGLSGATVS